MCFQHHISVLPGQRYKIFVTTFMHPQDNISVLKDNILVLPGQHLSNFMAPFLYFKKTFTDFWHHISVRLGHHCYTFGTIFLPFWDNISELQGQHLCVVLGQHIFTVRQHICTSGKKFCNSGMTLLYFRDNISVLMARAFLFYLKETIFVLTICLLFKYKILVLMEHNFCSFEITFSFGSH